MNIGVIVMICLIGAAMLYGEIYMQITEWRVHKNGEHEVKN